MSIEPPKRTVMAKSPRIKKYTISVIAEEYGVHPQTLRLYEREGLIKPSRSAKGTMFHRSPHMRSDVFGKVLFAGVRVATDSVSVADDEDVTRARLNMA